MKIFPQARIIMAVSLFLMVAWVPACTANTTSAADVARGGALYDQWWAVIGVSAPAGNHPLWSTQSTNTRQGADTWRCKECHGWDYLGKDGAYGTGSHFTGFPNIHAKAGAASRQDLLGILKGGNNPQHDFSAVMSETELSNLAAFLKDGIINARQHIDYETRRPLSANPANGEHLFSNNCAACHGTNGKQLNFGDAQAPEYVGGLAKDNPWEALHKIRFGQPGAPMPAGHSLGWSLGEMLDILAHAQTLPAA